MVDLLRRSGLETWNMEPVVINALLVLQAFFGVNPRAESSRKFHLLLDGLHLHLRGMESCHQELLPILTGVVRSAQPGRI